MSKTIVFKRLATAAMSCALILGVCAAAGCSSADATNQSVDDRIYAAQQSHPGRYSASGSHGCYGCHGATMESWPILATAPKLPAFHFTTDAPTSFADLNEAYQDCATCHIAVMGEADLEKAAE